MEDKLNCLNIKFDKYKYLADELIYQRTEIEDFLI